MIIQNISSSSKCKKCSFKWVLKVSISRISDLKVSWDSWNYKNRCTALWTVGTCTENKMSINKIIIDELVSEFSVNNTFLIDKRWIFFFFTKYLHERVFDMEVLFPTSQEVGGWEVKSVLWNRNQFVKSLIHCILHWCNIQGAPYSWDLRYREPRVI